MRPSPFVSFLKAFPVTSAITALNIAVYIYTCSKGASWVNPEFDVLVEMGASRRDRVWDGEFWRVLSPVVLHGHIAHIALNSYFMLSLCAAVEKMLGPIRFVWSYIGLGIAATSVSLIGHDATSVGASGAAFGLLGVLFAFLYRRMGSFKAFFNDPGVQRTLMFIVMFTVIGHFMNFDNFAHLGGLAFGFLLGLALTLKATPPLRIAAVAGFVVVLGGTVFAATRHWPGQETFWAFEIYNQGHPYRKSGDLERALERYDTSERYGNRRPKLYVYRGELHLELGNVEAAKRDLKRALLDSALEQVDREVAEALLRRIESPEKPEPPPEEPREP